MQEDIECVSIHDFAKRMLDYASSMEQLEVDAEIRYAAL